MQSLADNCRLLYFKPPPKSKSLREPAADGHHGGKRFSKPGTSAVGTPETTSRLTAIGWRVNVALKAPRS